MCGRTCCSISLKRLQHVSKSKKTINEEKYKRKYNLTPKSWTPIFYNEGSERVLCFAQWGLFPSFSKKNDEKMKKMSTINARFEGMTSSPIYRRLVNSHRCVFVVDGFYEWKTTAEGQKLPHFIRCPGTKNELKDESTSETLVKNESNDKNTGITSKTLVKNESDDGVIAILSDDEEALYFAGLYDIWREGETVLYTCSIVTMDSINTPMEHVHKRYIYIYIYIKCIL
eukprot:GHVL01040042.1.p1 GENE.GHVL01040042.1~~GHVL01040042.1.p1  ORF type:complete len:228 (-),score=48.47 GHVL01040042.1:230-913(-)